MLKVMKLRKTLLVSGLSSQIILGWKMAPLTKFRKTSLEYGLSSQIILDWKEVVHANSYGVHVCMGRP